MLWISLMTRFSLSEQTRTILYKMSSPTDLHVPPLPSSQLVTPHQSADETPPTSIETEHDRREKQVLHMQPCTTIIM